MKTTLKAKWSLYCAIAGLMGGSLLFFSWIHHNSPSSSSSCFSSLSGQSVVARDPSFHAQVPAQKPLTNDPPALSRVSTAIQKKPAAAKAHSKRASGFDRIQTPDYLQGAEELSCQETEPDANEVFCRIRLMKTDMKYPYLRVEEMIWKDKSSGKETVLSQKAAVADHIMVKLKEGLKTEDLEAINRKYGCEIRKVMGASGLYLVKLPTQDIDLLPAAIEQYRQEKNTIRTAEPDYVVIANECIPNDARYTEQWGLSQANDCDIWLILKISSTSLLVNVSLIILPY